MPSGLHFLCCARGGNYFINRNIFDVSLWDEKPIINFPNKKHDFHEMRLEVKNQRMLALLDLQYTLLQHEYPAFSIKA